MLYLDYAATTPISRQALNIYNEVALNYFGNPNSLHDIGSTAKQLLDKSREEIAKLINGIPSGVFFTSGGSESNATTIQSLVFANKHKGKHLITSTIEHSSITNIFHLLEDQGFEVTYLPVNEYGQISLNQLEDCIRKDTILASIQHGNSEIGTIQNLKGIGNILKKYDVLFHCDCVQTFGKVPINCLDMNIDSLSISSHKIYGPKGVGACYINPTCSWNPVIPNTSHEKGFRAGTVNVPGITAFVTAAEEIHEILQKEQKRMANLRNQFLEGISTLPFSIVIEGPETDVLPHIIGLRVKGLEGQYTMLECNRHGIAISTGSACQVGQQSPSITMIAIGRDSIEAKEFVRLSLGLHTTEQDIKQTIETFNTFLTAHYH